MLKTLSKALDTASFIERTWQGVARDVIDSLLRSEEFGCQTQVFVCRLKCHAREPRQDDLDNVSRGFWKLLSKSAEGLGRNNGQGRVSRRSSDDALLQGSV